MLTKEQILEKLKVMKVDMGKNPSRNFIFLQEKGLLPEGKYSSYDERLRLYPDWTPDFIKDIKQKQNDGYTLDKINTDIMIDQFTIFISIAFYLSDTQEVNLNGNTPKIVLNKVRKNLLKHNIIGFDVYKYNDENFVGTILFKDKIEFYLISNYQPFHVKRIKIEAKKTFSVEEYGELVRKTALKKLFSEEKSYISGKKVILRHHIIDRNDIVENIFNLYEIRKNKSNKERNIINE